MVWFRILGSGRRKSNRKVRSLVRASLNKSWPSSSPAAAPRGVASKNNRKLVGKPLITWTAEGKPLEFFGDGS
jgi:hypothetical protein